MKSFLGISLKFKDLFLSLIYTIIILFLLSLFVSFKKILIVLFLSILIFFLKNRLKKIFLMNLILLVLFLKVIFIFFDPKDYSGILSKTVYEKHFLYGVKNLNFQTIVFGGNMDPSNKEKKKSVNIITDNLGFRNSINVKDSAYILIGDSMLHNHRIDHSKLINVQLNKKSSSKFYNAAISSTDIGHYFETIKYFKTNNINKRFIMFVFTGNDFLNYKKIQQNYSQRIGSVLWRNYFEAKEFFDFLKKIKFIINNFQKNKLSKRVDKSNFINNENILFYKGYYLNPDHSLSFSKEFDIYNNLDPDILIVIPTKAQVYCKYLKNYNCDYVNYIDMLSSFSLFDNSLVYDSTEFLRAEADEYLVKSKFIYENNDTHLNELGLDVLSDFILDNLNE